MYRAQPVVNKLLSKRWQDKEQEIHKNKLREIKAMIEIREPTQFRHLKKKTKKTQMLEDRYTEIERENRILLEKMTSIMQTNNRSTIYSANAAMYQSIQNPPHTSSSMPPLAQHKRSLNKDARKRELLKITLENQAILKRLQDKQSNYNVYKWEEEEAERKKVLKSICEYPYLIDQPNIMQQSQISSATPSGQPDLIIKKRSTTTTMPFYKKKVYTGNNASVTQYQTIDDASTPQNSLFNGVQDLGNGLYNVSIQLSRMGELVIQAQHQDKPDSYVIEIQPEKIESLKNEFKGGEDDCFAQMAKHLKIMNRRMVLLNPRFIGGNGGRSLSPPKQNIKEETEEVIDKRHEYEVNKEGKDERSFSNMGPMNKKTSQTEIEHKEENIVEEQNNKDEEIKDDQQQ